MSLPRRLPVLLLLTLAMLLALAGCAAPSQPAQEAPAFTEAPAATEQPAATEAPAPQQSAATEASSEISPEAPEQPAATRIPVDTEKSPPAPGVIETQTGAAPPVGLATATTNREQPAEGAAGDTPTNQPAPTAGALGTLPPAPTSPPATPADPHTLQLEWPTWVRLGDSDVVRLTLIPAEQGYTLVTEFPEHTTLTQTLTVPRPPGYEVFAVARLDGPGFDLAPGGEQAQFLAPDQRLDWRWSLTPRQAGRQRLIVSLSLRWQPLTPTAEASAAPRQVTIFAQPLEIQVRSFLGLTRLQALLTGLLSLLFGGGLGTMALLIGPEGRRKLPRLLSPAANLALAIELPAGLTLNANERRLLQTLFARYARLVIEREFLSGYSGARAFLALPIHADGRSDAYTIAKLGERESIRHEFANYETYVKDTLPPVTARIQHAPVTLSDAPAKPASAASASAPPLAAVQYTFIGQAGQAPRSLRQALLDNPDPSLLTQLLDTFGPHWWLQRRPHTFRLAQEYDRLLPAHLVLEPLQSSSQRPLLLLDDHSSPTTLPGLPLLTVGQVVQVGRFEQVEAHAHGRYLSLTSQPPAGQPPLRLRWYAASAPRRPTFARITATRAGLLQALAADGPTLAAKLGLSDPLPHLPAILSETMPGSLSTIHGDLNLENILLGPGGLVWLIDFAQTRQGHPLLDFAHLYAELIAHILAPQISTPEALLNALSAPHPLGDLLRTVEDMAARCLFNPARPRERSLSFCLACLGALKYTNLDDHQRQMLYLAAAYQHGRD